MGEGEGVWIALTAGLVTSAVSGYLSIGFLLKFLKTHTTIPFVIYRVILGGGVILLTWFQVVG